MSFFSSQEGSLDTDLQKPGDDSGISCQPKGARDCTPPPRDTACQHLRFGFPALGYERTHFYSFKTPSLVLVMVALEIYYRVDFVVA